MAMKIKLTQLILLICFCLINTGLSFAAPWQDYNILNNPKPKVNYNNMALNNIIENSQNNADTFYYRRGLIIIVKMSVFQQIQEQKYIKKKEKKIGFP